MNYTNTPIRLVRNKVGIYQIRCIPTGKFYIGSSVNIGHRWTCHKLELRGKYHKNKYLQHVWDKYGEQSFSFEVVELIENISALRQIEQEWIRVMDSTNHSVGFNITDNTDSPRTGKKNTPESLAKAAATRKLNPYKPRQELVDYFINFVVPKVGDNRKPIIGFNKDTSIEFESFSSAIKMGYTNVSRSIVRGIKCKGLYFKYK